MANSNIPYLDKVWNPILGCDPKMACAARCWAARLVGRMIANPRLSTPFHNAAKTAIRHENLKAVGWSGQSALVEPILDAPFRWRKPQRIGACFLGDLFAASVSDEWIDWVWSVMARAHWHTFYVLTKQPEKMHDYLARLEPRTPDALNREACEWPLPNVRLGVSVCNQQEADERIPLLLATPAAFRWVSIEPMVGEVVLKQQNPDGWWPPNAPQPDVAHLRHKDWPDDFEYWTTGLNWVVVGCESGPSRRPCPWSWVENIVNQCKAAGTPCYVKQLDWDGVSRRVIYPGDQFWPAWAKQEQP